MGIKDYKTGVLNSTNLDMKSGLNLDPNRFDPMDKLAASVVSHGELDHFAGAGIQVARCISVNEGRLGHLAGMWDPGDDIPDLYTVTAAVLDSNDVMYPSVDTYGDFDPKHLFYEEYVVLNEDVRRPIPGELIYVQFENHKSRAGPVYVGPVDGVTNNIGTQFSSVVGGAKDAFGNAADGVLGAVAAAGRAVANALFGSGGDGEGSLHPAIKDIKPPVGIGDDYYGQTFKEPPIPANLEKRNNSLDLLHPNAQVEYRKLIEALRSRGLPFIVYETFRPQARQNFLFTQGRTREELIRVFNNRDRKNACGKIAHNPWGYSFDLDVFPPRPRKGCRSQITWAIKATRVTGHAKGMAVDFVLDEKHPYWKGERWNNKWSNRTPKERRAWSEFGKLVKSSEFKLKWGGDYGDRPHTNIRANVAKKWLEEIPYNLDPDDS